MAADNTILNGGTGGDTIRDLARQAGTVKTQVVQMDVGGASSNAEILATGRPDGYANVTGDPTTLLQDTFDTLDTTNTWTAAGTTPPTASGGNLTVAPGTAANSTSYLVSKPTFSLSAGAYLAPAMIVTLQSGATGVVGNDSFWGLGIVTTPTLTVPVTNGVIFETVATDGSLQANVYSGGSKTQSVALTRPTDGLPHRYGMFYKTSRVYFTLDNVIVGSIAYPNPSVSALNAVVGSTNGATVLVTGSSIVVSAFGIGDTGRNTVMLNDGLFPWRKNTIKPASAPAVGADTALVVAIRPGDAPLPAGAATETTLAGVRTDLGGDGTTPPAVLGGGTGVRGWLRSIYEKLTGTLAVTGTFFQATQPVSAASLPLPAGASTETTLAALNGKVTAVNTGAVVIPELRSTTLWVSATAATGAALTATLPAPAAGQFHYITAIDIQLYATAARTGAATPVAVTTTNLPGAPSWNFPTAQAIGTIDRYDVPLLTPIKSSVAATATTIVAPVATTGLWRINVGYYTGA